MTINGVDFWILPPPPLIFLITFPRALYARDLRASPAHPPKPGRVHALAEGQILQRN